MRKSDSCSRGDDADSLNCRDHYALYVDFEQRFLAYSIRCTTVEWVRRYYRQSFRLVSRMVFDRRIERMTSSARAHHCRRWQMGFDAWLREELQKESRLLTRLNEFGCTPAVAHIINVAVRRYEEVFPRKRVDTVSNKDSSQDVLGNLDDERQ